MYSCDTERFSCFVNCAFVSLGVSLINVALMELCPTVTGGCVWVQVCSGEWMTTLQCTCCVVIWSQRFFVFFSGLFCHESYHSYLMCNKEQSKQIQSLFFLNCAILFTFAIHSGRLAAKMAACVVLTLSFYSDVCPFPSFLFVLPLFAFLCFILLAFGFWSLLAMETFFKLF